MTCPKLKQKQQTQTLPQSLISIIPSIIPVLSFCRKRSMKLPTILLLCLLIFTTSTYSTLDKSSKKKKNIIDELRLSVNRSSPKMEKSRPFRQIRLLNHLRKDNGDVIEGNNHNRIATVNGIERQIMYSRRRSCRFNLFLATFCNTGHSC